MLEALGNIGRNFLFGLLILVFGVPLAIIVYGAAIAYLIAPAAGGIWLAINVVHPALVGAPIPDWAVIAIPIAVAVIVAVLGWSIEYEINDRTGVPYEVLGM